MPANLPNRPEGSFKKKILNYRRQEEKPSDGDLLKAFNDYSIGTTFEPDLSSAAPKSPEHPSYEFIVFLRCISRYEREWKPLQWNCVPATTQIFYIVGQSEKSNPIGRCLKVGIHFFHRKGKLMFEPNDHDSDILEQLRM